MAHTNNVPLNSRHPILDDCRNLSNDLENLQLQVDKLETNQANFIAGTSTSTKESLDAENTLILSDYRLLIDKVRHLRSQPGADDSTNKYQLAALDRKVRKSINDFRTSESRFISSLQDQQRRQYRIVYPDASDHDIDEAVENGEDVQVFQQALLHADRRGNATGTVSHVRQRHEQIQGIERTLLELQDLFETLDREVVTQDYQTVRIEDEVMSVGKDVEGGNVQMTRAVGKARAARKKRWICGGICLIILVFIIAAILIWLKVTHQI